jgi:hypothetical protein
VDLLNVDSPDSGQIGRRTLLKPSAHRTSLDKPYTSILHGSGEFWIQRSRVLPALKVNFVTFRFKLALVIVMKVVVGVVIYIVLKFDDHRRWSDRQLVGPTCSHFGQSVWPPMVVIFMLLGCIFNYEYNDI